MDTSKDNNEQVKETKTVAVQKNADHASFFDKDETFVFIFKKTEKLTAAVYVVTNLFSDSEPMKWTVRKKVSDLLSFTVKYKDVLPSLREDFVHEAKSMVMEIISLLQVSSLSGLISPMNFSIIQREFLNLIDVLDMPKPSGKESSHHSLAESFFDVVGLPEQLKQSANFIKDNNIVSETNVFKKTNRQNIILGLLKKKKELTIKDISHVIKDCSEKTIQRELLTLISAGVLKKIGERRWSKYSMV